VNKGKELQMSWFKSTC